MVIPKALSVRGMSVNRELGLHLCSCDGSNSTLSPVVSGDIYFFICIYTQRNISKCYRTQSAI